MFRRGCSRRDREGDRGWVKKGFIEASQSEVNSKIIKRETDHQMRKKSSITELARNLRKRPTNSEKELWKYLRKRQLNGLKFLRQKPIVYKCDRGKTSFFIADFYCPEKKLVVELDGPIHQHKKYEDSQRDRILATLGLKTLRIRNDELRNIEIVLDKISESLK